MSDLQSNLAEFIRRLGVDDDRLDQLERRTTALGQGIRNLWTDGTGKGSACITTITGKIVGGLTVTLTPMPDTSLQVKGGVTGTDYGTYAVPTGTYDISIFGIDPADTSLDLYPFGPVSPRFNGALPLAANRAIIRCTTNPLIAVVPPAAAGYGYITESVAGSFACQYPVGVLDWTDSLIGSGTTTLFNFGLYGQSAVGSWGAACQLANSFATIHPCTARTGVPIAFFMNQQAQAGFRYQTASIFNPCPVAGPCPGNGNGASTAFGAAITSKTCPSFDLTTKFDCTWAVNDQMWHNSTAQTIRFYEP